LGDIPLLKFFFSTKGNTTSRSSLVILLRADITVVPDAERRFLEEN
jgi:type II secretory pathway component GspD/PulD (secretin)